MKEKQGLIEEVILPPMEGPEYEVSQLLDDAEIFMGQALSAMDTLTAILLPYGGLSSFDALRSELQQIYIDFDNVNIETCDEEKLTKITGRLKYILRRLPAIFKHANTNELKQVMLINISLNETLGKLTACKEFDLPIKKKKLQESDAPEDDNPITIIYHWGANRIRIVLYSFFS